jgi:exopolysaccharide/PEP-CTERM locus tyrosine autokinase
MGKMYEALEKSLDSNQGKPQSKRGKGRKQRGHQLSSELVVLGNPASPIAEQFRFLRSKICRPLQGDNPRSILITSSVQGEGKSFVAVNLAVTIAQGLDEHVLLVDTDLRLPRLHEIFALQRADRGLADHLQDEAPLQELLQKPGIGKLSLLPAGLHASKPAELLSSSRMKRFIIEVKHRYPDRYVIFDSPPLGMAPELSIMAQEMEAVFLVVRRAETPREAVKASLEKLDRERFKGIILNGYDKPKKYYKKYGYRSKGSEYGYGYNYEESASSGAKDRQGS